MLAETRVTVAVSWARFTSARSIATATVGVTVSTVKLVALAARPAVPLPCSGAGGHVDRRIRYVGVGGSP